ncbi:CpsB/CapC family capsule biosynthesis tyrosine phosphatase [Johnsonella ignava]|jgi:Capsular polysaccharide biosynthesis protein|uniref:CpsB/CapC family capsule biosynthesis tyrosine phosphatase n=1 Tax=Johnsonella ignava TaxID=43995 RepID=UPI0023F4FB4B|nr:CpsB/CapC family capsule biosynthesis tyrosine phosphatase [Johnsonella ignava]
MAVNDIINDTGFIDIHAHILPGVDDGAENMQEALYMAYMAYNNGIRHIIATPHSKIKYTVHELENKLAILQNMIYNHSLKLKLYLGQEIFYNIGSVGLLKEGKLATMAKSRYVLVEFDINIAYAAIYAAVREFINSRYIPIIAHAERYACLYKRGRIEELKMAGCKVQVNYESVCSGLLNARSAWCRAQLLAENIDYLGTDMHGVKFRTPDITKSCRWIDRHLKKEYIRKIVHDNAEEFIKQAED